MKSFLLIIILLIHLSTYGQRDSTVMENDNSTPIEEETQVINEPKMAFIDDTELFVSFPGGEEKFKKYLIEKINFENIKSTKKSNIVVIFRIDEQGKVDQVKIEGIENEELEKEISQVFYNMKRWIWGRELKKKERKKVYKAITLILD